MITTRGAERPAKIKWSRPFLPQLKPPPTVAARDMFVDIADGPSTPQEETALQGLLEVTASVPLAISLMASVASAEGYTAALSRWEAERTVLMSEGFDKRSNLEKSILVSLNSPRLSVTPHARHLLCLLSLLPDGTSDVDLIKPVFPSQTFSSRNHFSCAPHSLMLIRTDGLKSSHPSGNTCSWPFPHPRQ
jgi:hypothetical protein